MSDLFHEEIPEDYIRQVFDVIRRAPQHTFQVLTKRAERMAIFFKDYEPPENAWLGVTVEDRKFGVPRLDWLRQVPAHIRFVSVEPLLEDLGALDLSGIHWVIVGGESGPKARPMQQEWVLNIKRQCDEQHSAFFFKQWGGWGVDGKKRAKKQNGRLLQGRTWDAVPLVSTPSQCSIV
jgi:protein gp37